MNCICKYLLECIDELFSGTGIMAIMSINQRKEKTNKPFLVPGVTVSKQGYVLSLRYGNDFSFSCT